MWSSDKEHKTHSLAKVFPTVLWLLLLFHVFKGVAVKAVQYLREKTSPCHDIFMNKCFILQNGKEVERTEAL